MRKTSWRGVEPFVGLLAVGLLFSSSSTSQVMPANGVEEPDHHAQAWHLIHQALDEGRRLLDAGRLDEAEAKIRPMIERAAELEGQDVQLAGDVVEVLAEVLHRSGKDFQREDQKHLFGFLGQIEKTLGPHHPAVAQVLLEIACMSYTWGTVEETEKLLRRALHLHQPTAQGDPLAAPRNHLFLGNLLNEGGYPGKAQLAYAEALRLAEDELGTVDELLRQSQLEVRHGLIAEILSDIATTSASLGDFTTARKLFAQASTLFEMSIGLESPIAALVHYNLAWVERRTGNSKKALAELHQVLEAWEARLGAEHFYLGIARLEFGSVLADLDRLSEARRELETSTENLKAHLGDSYRTAGALSQLADIMWRQGDFVGAQRSYEEAQEMYTSAGFLEHPGAAHNLNQLGRLLWRNKNPEAAFDVALRAEAIGRGALRTYMHSTAEREALFLDDLRPSGLDLLATVLAEGSGNVAAGWSEVIRSRTLVFDEITARHRATREGNNPNEQQRWSALAQARQRLANLHVRHRGGHNAEPRLREALVAREAAERNLESLSKAFRQENQHRHAGFHEIRRHLPSATALLAYVRYQHLDQDSSGPRAPGTPSYLAFAWAPGMTQPVAVPLGTAAIIDQQVESARRQIGRHSEIRYRRAAEKLRRLVWDPIAPHVESAERLLVVADGSLHQMPLIALPIADNRYWIERGQDLKYLTAERDLLTVPLKKDLEEQELALLSLGGPDFDSFAALSEKVETSSRATLPKPTTSTDSRTTPLPDCDAWQEIRYVPLLRSAHEAHEVATLHRKWAAEDRVVELVGAAATEGAFKTWAPLSRNLHLATHGFSWQSRCDNEAAVSTPLLWSGLALAGANHRDRAPTTGEDGILTAEEIMSLDLSSVDWAVLSACDTGVGESVPGEGVLGLQRAFRIAGVRTLIVSLWPVDDQVTSELMAALYRGRWQQNLDAASAVAAASLEILNQRRQQSQDAHPYFWAPFVAMGR